MKNRYLTFPVRGDMIEMQKGGSASLLFTEESMTLQEVCSTYHLDAALLGSLAQRGVFLAQTLGDDDICRASLACFLAECGLTAEQVAAYFLTQDAGKTQRVMLRRLRAEALERSHAEQRRVDKLDCLLRRLDEGCGGAPCPKK